MKYKFFHTHQERRSKPFILLEIGLIRLRLHAVDAARAPIRITLLREEFLSPGDSNQLLETVQNVLNTDTAIRDLSIVMNSPAIHHQILRIPQMSRSERQKILQLEMKHSSPSREISGTVSFWSAGKTKEQNSTSEHVLCAELSQSVVNDLITAAREKNFNLIGFTSYAQMATKLLKECRLDGKLNVALLEISDREGSIMLFHNNIWNMDRHFPIGSARIPSDVQELPELDAEKIKLEVGRALQYFKQQVRNENIGHILIFGNTNHADAIKKLLESSFRIPVAPITLERKQFTSSDLIGAQTGILPLYEIVHAAALHSQFDKYINFLPPELHSEKHIKTRQRALVGSAVALYAILGSFAFILNREVLSIRTGGQAERQAPPMNMQAPQSAQQFQIDRSFALATERSYKWLRSRHHIVAELARELAEASPSQMRVSGLEVIEKGNTWHVELKAEIRSSNGSQSQHLFLKFQDQMAHLFCLKQLTWGDVQLMDSTSPADPADSEAQDASLLTFTMRGMLDGAIFAGKTKSTPPQSAYCLPQLDPGSYTKPKGCADSLNFTGQARAKPFRHG
jgi:Tfp pilus assembly PilM family ATPase